MIQWNSELVKRLSCSSEEKKELPQLIHTLVKIAEKARTEGAKNITGSPDITEFPLLSYGFRLLSEGISTESLEEILTILLATAPDTGFDFLTQCLCAETIVSIAGGDPASTTLRKLAPYCGIEQALNLLTSAEDQGSRESP